VEVRYFDKPVSNRQVPGYDSDHVLHLPVDSSATRIGGAL
jgi:hypothetical protein